MTAPARAVSDFRILLPPGWARVPLDGRAPLRIKNLVTERVRDLPAPRRAELRAWLTRELTAAIEAAARQGGIDVLLSVDPVAGRPVPASGLITHVRGRGDGTFESLLRTLGSGGEGVQVRELGVVEVAGARAVRRLTSRREEVPAEDGGPGGVLTVTQVDFFVPVPGSDDLLLLTFTTPVEQLGPPLVKLFDVMGGSLRWVLT
ncbi:hypothetical protein DQ244_17285 [Blastococcus sp. TBT05-19]|uniref:hypothetical protein n=1 Tax=Blastococcus sp. TBT05-19 TaxID=2250581 RepID=UPI000DE9D611|nr:hypothetical protein [Blastococcus sp. TBT05-19]RBY87092.1 hypothetical protein DQ244_17285 [Blastococcus sp. TBT05-19]